MDNTLKCDAAGLDDAARVRLLLRKLSDTTHAEYMNHILPKMTRDYKFSETVDNLTKLFGAHVSLFSKRYHCLTLNKRASVDFQSYAGQVNRCCEDFGVAQCSVDAFKCLIFVCGLHNKQDAEIRTSLLAKLEGNANMTLDNLTAESDQKPTATRSRSPHNSNNNNPHISSNSRGGSSKNNNKPRTPCWKCGELHYVEFCQYLNHRCRDCNRVGHKDGYCQCVRSNPGKKRREKSSQPVHTRGIYVRQLAVHRNRKFMGAAVADWLRCSLCKRMVLGWIPICSQRESIGNINLETLNMNEKSMSLDSGFDPPSFGLNSEFCVHAFLHICNLRLSAPLVSC
ncbi:conserved hypothetical protein [Culex quinquefasciatus]|uniref:DUF7083 domain-containing protein n=1 Tax=Culex quinquefasciatus TaxID=7176 RepID=B0XJ08_CULQU|nr:conserved hypothetical protein [Culex quinquefasciatus]|eukprot:XP_001869630.1 conserved hypothetical protein [Culex quinquefasciatus]